jgi:hypothetical protein
VAGSFEPLPQGMEDFLAQHQAPDHEKEALREHLMKVVQTQKSPHMDPRLMRQIKRDYGATEEARKGIPVEDDRGDESGSPRSHASMPDKSGQQPMKGIRALGIDDPKTAALASQGYGSHPPKYPKSLSEAYHALLDERRDVMAHGGKGVEPDDGTETSEWVDYHFGKGTAEKLRREIDGWQKTGPKRTLNTKLKDRANWKTTKQIDEDDATAKALGDYTGPDR